MSYTFASATILLLLITDPLGNIPIFANALRGVAPERRARVILREVLIAFALLLVFLFFGAEFLRVMNLSDLSLQIAGAVVLFLIALRMIFPSADGPQTELPGEPLMSGDNIDSMKVPNVATGRLPGLESLGIRNKVSGEEQTLDVDAVFIAIGHVPDNKAFASLVELDAYGYIKTDENCATSCPGIYAAGDGRVKKVRQLTTAAADGTEAALAACDYIDLL